MGQKYVSAWDNGIRSMGGHWIKEGSRSASDTLDALMTADHVIRVGEDGLIYDDVRDVYEPEIIMGTDDNGQILQEHDDALIGHLRAQGWEPELGWTGQYGDHSRNPVMHTSEFIGGPLAKHIVSTPGYWVCCPVYVDSEVCPNESKTCKLSDPCVICYDGTGEDREQVCAGWLVAHREASAAQG